MDHNAIVKICQDAIDTPYQYGRNDCNSTVLQMVDLIAGTDLQRNCTYKTFKGGLRKLKELGFESTLEMISEYVDEVQITIDGDIWVDPINPHTICIVISNRLLGVNNEHTEFNLVPKRNDGTYYRIRKSKWVEVD